MKMRVVYAVTGGLKYIGHLDLMRAFQRALRRSRLPVCYSQGFNPHILLTLAAPLSVGYEGQREVMDIPLACEVPEDDFLRDLNAALPPLIRCLEARTLPDDHPKPMAALAAASYFIRPLEDNIRLQQAIPEFLQLEHIPSQRKGKRGMVDFDLRPLIYTLRPQDEGIMALLALAQQGTCRPDLLMQSLSAFAGLSQPPPCHISRAGLYAERFIPLEKA